MNHKNRVLNHFDSASDIIFMAQERESFSSLAKTSFMQFVDVHIWETFIAGIF